MILRAFTALLMRPRGPKLDRRALNRRIADLERIAPTTPTTPTAPARRQPEPASD